MRKVLMFLLILFSVCSCTEKAVTSTHGYGKVTVLHPSDSIPVPGANVKISDDSTLIIQGLTDINGEFEFEMETPVDTNVYVYSSYVLFGVECVAATDMLIHPGDTTEAVVFGY